MHFESPVLAANRPIGLILVQSNEIRTAFIVVESAPT